MKRLLGLVLLLAAPAFAQTDMVGSPCNMTDGSCGASSYATMPAPSGCVATSVMFFGTPVTVGPQCDTGLTYDAATDTLTTKLSYPRPADNSTFSLWKTTPPAGRTNEAPFELYFGGATFESEWDPVMYLGYNASEALAAEPGFRWVIEGNYKHTQRDIESYWEYRGAGGVGTWRPIFVTIDKTSTAAPYGTLQFSAATVVTQALVGSPMILRWEHPQDNSAIYLTAQSNTGNRAKVYFGIGAGGANDPAYAPTILMTGKDTDNFVGVRGKMEISAPAVDTPVSGGREGAISLITKSTTERVRVEQGGNVAIGKPGVAASALLDVNGSARLGGSDVNAIWATSGRLYPDGTGVYLGGSVNKWAGLYVSTSTLGSKSKALTDATPTAFATFTIADGATYTGEVIYNVKAVKGTALQALAGRVRFVATREGSTYTVAAAEVGTQTSAMAAGTLTGSISIAGTAGVVTLSATFDTSQSSPDSFAINYRFDSPDAALAITPL